MLVLSMNLDDRIYIGDDIVIQYVGTKNGHVRIGFEAPRDVEILREKVKRDIERSGRRET